jgi:urea transport system ATP-binding protein
MLDVQSVSTGYGKVSVVHDVGFALEKGELLSIVGSNGAGKTTLLRALIGLLPLHTGSVKFQGKDVSTQSPHRRVRAGMAYVPQGQQSFGQLTTEENLMLVADRYGKESTKRRNEVIEMFPVLGEFKDRRAGLLSGGQRQQLAIARALITHPRLMILDEPTEGIQPNVVADIQQSILSMTKDLGIAVVLVEQQVGFAIAKADRYVALAAGRAVAAGDGGPQAVDVVRQALAI